MYLPKRLKTQKRLEDLRRSRIENALAEEDLLARLIQNLQALKALNQR